ncbi:MAG: hypothetical protein AAB694_00260 [Patescibacteria group bacterium]
MSKRRKFIFTSIILAGAFLIIQLTDVLFRYEAIVAVIVGSGILSLWSLREAVGRNATLLTLVLPVAFTAGVGFFYFLLPSALLARLPVVFLYGLGMYALLLTANIYNVAAIRTIALLRAAHAVGFLLTLAASFFLFDTLWSFRLTPWVNGGGTLLLSFPLVLQSVWSIELEERLSRRLILWSVVVSAVLGEIGFMISLWPVTVVVASLFLTTVLYVLLGLLQAELVGRLFARTVKEYLLVGLVVLLAVYLSSKWGG